MRLFLCDVLSQLHGDSPVIDVVTLQDSTLSSCCLTPATADAFAIFMHLCICTRAIAKCSCPMCSWQSSSDCVLQRHFLAAPGRTTVAVHGHACAGDLPIQMTVSYPVRSSPGSGTLFDYPWDEHTSEFRADVQAIVSAWGCAGVRRGQRAQCDKYNLAVCVSLAWFGL
jgi:hypothetical protein